MARRTLGVFIGLAALGAASCTDRTEPQRAPPAIAWKLPVDFCAGAVTSAGGGDSFLIGPARSKHGKNRTEPTVDGGFSAYSGV